jgi:hypothetical protein
MEASLIVARKKGSVGQRPLSYAFRRTDSDKVYGCHGRNMRADTAIIMRFFP